MATVCKDCGSPVKDGAKFCPRCGNPVAQPVQQPSVRPIAQPPRCAWCGAQVKGSSKFCPKCGKTVGSVPPGQSQPAQPIPPAAPQRLTCPSCGAALKTTSKFCPRCGRTVAAAASAAGAAYGQQGSRFPAPPYPAAQQPKRSPGLLIANIALGAVCVVLAVLAVITIPRKKSEGPTVQPGAVAADNYDEDVSAQIAADYEAIARGGTLLPAPEEGGGDLMPHTFSDWASEGEED